MKKQIKFVLYIVFTSLLLISCSDDSDSNPVDDNGGKKAVVKGRVTDNDGYGNGLNKLSAGIEGASVTTAEIQSNGTLSTTSEANVQTNVNGEFAVNTSSTGKSNVVVVATKGTSEWKALISSSITATSDNYCPPLNNETTAEVDVYSEVVADNKAQIVGYHDVAFHVSSQIAAKIRSNIVTKTEVKNAIVSKVEARAAAFMNTHYGYSNAQYEEAKKVDEDSQKEFERDLYFSNDNEASYRAVWEKYFNARVSGYSNTSIAMTHYAQSEEISGKAMLKFNSNIESESMFELAKRNAYLKAKLIARAMIEEHDKAGGDQQHRQNVEEENNNLLLAIRNSSSISGINQAYVNYRSAIKANVKSSFNTIATSLTIIEAAIETTIKTSLDASVAAATNIQSLISAYTTFYAGVHTTVNGELNLPNSAQVEAIANMYALMYMHN